MNDIEIVFKVYYKKEIPAYKGQAKKGAQERTGEGTTGEVGK